VSCGAADAVIAVERRLRAMIVRENESFENMVVRCVVCLCC
jgi:hypothetical protein